MDFLYQIVIYPIQLFIEIIYITLYHALEHVAGRSGYAIIGVSLAVSFLTLPMYVKAEKLQDIQRDILKKMEKKLESIKRNFKGDKKYMLISAYYKKNSYHPLMVLRSSLSLFIMIPFFMAAYIFLSEPRLLSGESFFFLTDLSKQDQLINLFGLRLNLLPILMTVINIFSGYIYSEKLSKSEKFQLYITAIVFLFLLYTSPSGLVFYWTCNNIFSLFKNIWMKYNFKIGFNISFILNRFDKLENFNTDSCFILSMFLFWLLIGLVIPTDFMSSSSLEICKMCRDMSIWKVLSYPVLQSFGIFVFWGILIFYLADKKIKNLFTLFSISTFIYSLIQMYLYPYGLADFTFRFSPYMSKTTPVVSCLLIIIYIFTLFILYKIFVNNKEKIISSIMSILIIACLMTIFVNVNKINNGYVRYNEIVSIDLKDQISNNKIFKFTKTGKNVLIIFLDRAISSFFPLIMEKNENLKKSYEGFIYYPNTATFYCHTILGTPPIFGGYEYTPIEMNKRKGLMKDKHNEALLVLPSIFKNKGAYVCVTDAPLKNYEWISDNKLYKEKGINAYNLLGCYTEKFLKDKLDITFSDSSPSVLLKHDFLFFSFMKISDSVIRHILYNDKKYLNPIYLKKNNIICNPDRLMMLDSYSTLLELNNLSDFTCKENLTLNIMINNLTHDIDFFQLPKYTIEKKVNNIGINFIGNRKSFRFYHGNTSSLYRLSEWFEELKANGVYDNTRIIIVSDHGFSLVNNYCKNERATFFNALLVVKDFNSKGYYKIDDTLMTNADVPYIATKDVINNPINPFTGKSINEFDKSKGINVLNQHLYNPQDFDGDKCIFQDYYFHIKNSVLNSDDWKVELFSLNTNSKESISNNSLSNSTFY